MDLKLTGLAEVQQNLKDASRLIVAASFAKALDRAAGVFAAEVQAQAGTLGESGSDTPLSEHVVVKVEVDTERRGGMAAVGFDSSEDARTGVPQDLKALWVEYGHKMMTHATGTETFADKRGRQRHRNTGKRLVGVVPMHPFMRPAFEASAEKAIEVFAESLSETLSSLSSLPGIK